MRLLCSVVEILASFVESVLIICTVITPCTPKFDKNKAFYLVLLSSTLTTIYVVYMNTLSAFSFLTPIGTMIIVIFIVGKLLTNGKTALRGLSCVLALFVIQSIDYILIIGLTLLQGNPRELFAEYLKPGFIRVGYLAVDKGSNVILYFWLRKYLFKISELREVNMVKLLLCTTLAYGTMQYLFGMVLHGDLIQLQGAAIVFFFVLLCFLFIIVFSMITLTASEKEKAANQMLSSLNQMMEENYYAQNERITDNAKALHDFHHHLSVIDTLARKEDCLQVSEYVHSVLTTAFLPTQLCHSGNSIIDAVINSKLSEAKQKEIQMEYTIKIADLSSFEQADICAILSNQIENAFDACEKQASGRNVQIDIRQQEGFVLFTVTNPVISDPFLTNENLLSTKTDSKRIHGLGLRNVRDIAQKYNGTLTSKYADGNFISTVLVCTKTI